MHWYVCVHCEFERFQLSLESGQRCPMCDQPMDYRGVVAEDGGSTSLLPPPPKVPVSSSAMDESDGHVQPKPSPSALSSGNKFSSSAPTTSSSCKPGDRKDEANRIVSVEILDGAGAVIDEAPQWVNLPKAAGWRDLLALANTDRLGNEISARVTFSKAGPVAGTVALECKDFEGVSLDYSRSEIARNPRRFADTCRADLNGVALDEKFQCTFPIRLAMPGGRTYRLTVTDGAGNSASSTHVTIWRKLYYRVIAMAGVTVPDLAPVTAYLRKRYIDFRRVGDVREIEGFYLHPSTRGRMMGALGDGPNVDAHRPHLITIFFIWDWVTRASAMVNLKLTMPATADAAAPLTRRWKANDTRLLWHGVFHGLEARDWLEECFLVKYGENPEDLSRRMAIPKDLFTPARAAGDPADHYANMVCDKVALRNRVGATAGAEYLFCFKAAIANSDFLGLGPPDTDLLLVCCRPDGKVASADQLRSIILHELGHKLGMVPDGSNGKGAEVKSRSRLDKPKKQYAGGGHAGSHCNEKTGKDQDDNCLMHGDVNLLASKQPEFCDVCTLALHKLDWRGWVPHPAAPDTRLFDD